MKRSFIQGLLLTGISLLSGLLSLFLVLKLYTAPVSASWAVVTVDQALPDRETAEALSSLGPGVISESGQWVFLDNFGSLELVGLEELPGRLESFDPRRDPYAEKLHDFFVRDGTRYFFIPLERSLSPWAMRGFEKKIAVCLAGIPFRVSYTGASRPFLPYVLVFAAAALAGLFFSGSPLCFLFLLPLLPSLALEGPAGLSACAFLSGSAAFLLEPLREIFVSRRYQNHFSVLEIIKDNRFNWLCSLLFLIPALVIIFVYLSPLVIPAVPLFYFLWIQALRLESCRGMNVSHVRFIPVSILPFSGKRSFARGSLQSMFRRRPAFPRAGLPFALAAICAFLFLLVGVRPGEPAPLLAGRVLSEEDYKAHVLFQSSFSYKSLWETEEFFSMNHYTLGEDGLIAGMIQENIAVPVIPPFPLKNLFEGLSGPVSKEDLRSLPVVCLALLCSLPGFIFSPGFRKGGKKKKMALYDEKWIAA
ncbi:MAG: hypothetical protein LBK83_15420 [Treponema sp.]|nr:hypothetical protein [Treponema sp.]